MDTLTFFGLIGATCILGAFFQVSRNAWKGKSWQFQLLNFIGALILMIYSWMLNAHALAALNFVWVVIATVGLYQYFIQRP